MFSMDSYISYADIIAALLRGSPNFYENFRQTYTYTGVHISFWLFIRNTKNSFIMTWTIPD